MFLRYYVDLGMPFEEVEPTLLAAPETWTAALARKAGDQAELLLAEVGFTVAQRRIGREVAISFGNAHRLASRTVLPMTWVATGSEGLLPALDADLEVAALGPNRTQLSISARYQPPMGAVGRALDRALLHRVAEATVKDFLDRVAEAIEGWKLCNQHREAGGHCGGRAFGVPGLDMVRGPLG
ncbi:MAG: hypothetical protein M3P43_03180 [Actinomycetota bacterium]|nr:hypothetical protein [Actinomycetota bacterium]